MYFILLLLILYFWYRYFFAPVWSDWFFGKLGNVEWRWNTPSDSQESEEVVVRRTTVTNDDWETVTTTRSTETTASNNDWSNWSSDNDWSSVSTRVGNLSTTTIQEVEQDELYEFRGRDLKTEHLIVVITKYDGSRCHI